MPQCIAAVFKAVSKALRALLCPPKGRHSAGQLRRRRSTRVRRYAPRTPAAPAPLPSHPVARKSQASAAERPHPKPPASPTPPASLEPPTVEIDADEIALVRPYFTAHEPEGEAERIQNRATARLCQWGADLWSDPDPVLRFGPAPAGTRAYTLDEFLDPGPEPDPDPVAAPSPEPAPEARAHPATAFHVPAPRPPSPRLPARMHELPHLSRIRARQQERLTRVSA
ncbi:hypothetical protein [Nocardiopsis kunsanensis]|uniref:Uncharacterized protein n=1 Tax=Nocardiopsis kunsanensis TaxID=141693 RepID=A0A918XFG7_9ACTN|nr:hypothetical protein [Nocardiopsis kunsanensis]GHD29602.1 hypothetical protein GCM10007147_30770 [Nocardiopsis kunsanensis]